jgi:hypothetical protein
MSQDLELPEAVDALAGDIAKIDVVVIRNVPSQFRRRYAS